MPDTIIQLWFIYQRSQELGLCGNDMEGCNSKLVIDMGLIIPQFSGWTVQQIEACERKAGMQSEIRNPDTSFTRQKL